MNLTKVCEETRSLMITQLIGLAETQRRIYETLHPTKELAEAYRLHQQELELLIKCQRELI